MEGQKKATPLAGGAERYRTIYGVAYDCTDRKQAMAYRRAKYRMRKGRFPFPRRGCWVIPRRDPAGLSDQARSLQRVLRASCPEGIPIIEIDW